MCPLLPLGPTCISYIVCFQKYCTFEEVDVLTNVTKETNVSVSVDGTTKFIMENVTEEIMLTEKIPLEKCKLRVQVRV